MRKNALSCGKMPLSCRQNALPCRKTRFSGGTWQETAGNCKRVFGLKNQESWPPFSRSSGLTKRSISIEWCTGVVDCRTLALNNRDPVAPNALRRSSGDHEDTISLSQKWLFIVAMPADSRFEKHRDRKFSPKFF